MRVRCISSSRVVSSALGRGGLLTILLAALVFLDGCSATRLATLQREFSEYQKLEEKPSQNIQRWEDLQESSTQGYLEIAEGALEGAEKASKTTTQVAFLRLAAVAGWQAGAVGDDVYSKAQTKGATLCADATIWESAFRPPRDCTLLLILPAVVASTRLTPRIKPLVQTSQAVGLLGEDQVPEATELFQQYPINTWQYVFDRYAKIVSATGIDDSVKLFVEREERTYYCNFLGLERAIATLDGHQELRSQALAKRKEMFTEMKDAGRTPDCRT